MAKKKRSQKRGSGKGINLRPFFGFCLRSIPFLLIFCAFGGIFIGVRDALYADPSLSIQKVEVSPADSLSIEQRTKLDSMLLGQNIMTVDLRKAARTLEKDPGVQNAKVVKHMPSKIGVEIVRRKAVACIQFAPQGNCGLVSDDGVILDVISFKNATGLILEAFETTKREPQIGMRPEVRGFYQSMKFMKAYEELELARFEPLTRIAVDHLGNVSIILGNGPQIRLGRRPVECIKSLDKVIPLLKSEERSKIEYVDLQYDNVIVKRKK